MGYAAIDPSYSRTGLALFEGDKMFLTYVKKEEATSKDYQSMFHRMESLTDRIVNEIESRVTPVRVISEEPLPSASFSAGLFALDSLLFHKIGETKSLEELYNVHPSYLVHIHGRRDYTKSDSVNLAKKLISRYEKFGVKVCLETGRLAHDTAEALIFLTRLLVLSNVRVKGHNIDELLVEFPMFKTSKEKLLIRKDR